MGTNQSAATVPVPTKPTPAGLTLLLVGDVGVGKSCVVGKYGDKRFMIDSTAETIALDFNIRTIKLEGKRIKLQIWDTSGKERFQEIITPCYRRGQGIILVYDITSKRSFDNITHRFLQRIEQHAPKDVERILIGNGCDLEAYRKVPRERGAALAHELGIPFLETSAKTGFNIDETFETLVKQILRKRCDTPPDRQSGHSAPLEKGNFFTPSPTSTEGSGTNGGDKMEQSQSGPVPPSEGGGDGTSSNELPREEQTTSSSQVPLGHILTKFELQVLSDLLDAYSNEKIKEIQQSIRKKQGGDISREEVERSLREGGLTTVADELEQNLLKGVEKAQHYEAYKAALEGAKTLTLRYLRFLLIGVPRSGKSTMRRRMLQEIVNLSSLGQLSVSTGVAESYDVLVKKMTSESAAISGSKWWSLKKQPSDASQADGSDEGDLHYLTHLFYSLISKPTADIDAMPNVDPATNSEAHDISQTEENNRVTEATATIADTGRQQLSVADEPALCDDSDQKDVDIAFEKLTNILQSDSPEDLHKLLHALTLINLIDIGGQPEFLDMLPAVTIGAALYFLFFRLDQDLHRHYPVTFLAPGESSEKTLETSYCIEEVIHQALASIASFSGQLSEDKAESASSCAILIGTHKDKVEAKDIAHKEEEVNEKFMKVEMYKDLLLKTQQEKPFFAVDNMNGTDESEMSEIRSNIEKIVKTCFAEVPIPASWLMFRIVLHLMNKPVIALTQCEEVARRLSMPTPVQEALWFFHHNIGSLLYYQDIPSMKDLVICTPQVIFDSVSTVIIDNFKHGNYRIARKAVEHFQQTGLFSLSDISTKTEHHRSTHLSPNQLVDVLKHNGILAEVKSDDEEATSSPVEPKYIIPAVLKHASEEELKPSSSLEASPLMIRFEGGFVPFGVFSASIARLIACANSLSPKWSLHGKEVNKNKVKFLVAKAFVATLISRPQYLEIQIEKFPRARYEHTLAQICSAVRQTVVETLETTISKMKYRPRDSIAAEVLSSQRPFDLAFPCCLDYPKPHSDHLMKVDKDKNEHYGECLLDGDADGPATNLESEHLLWFGQDKPPSQSEATPTLKSSLPSPSSGMLSIDDLHKVKEAAWEVRAKWYDLGLALGVPCSTLDAVEKSYQSRCDDCFRESLKEWLKGADPPPTWSALCSALKSPSLGYGELAEELSKKHCQHCK